MMFMPTTMIMMMIFLTVIIISAIINMNLMMTILKIYAEGRIHELVLQYI